MFENRRLIIATKHGKETVIAPALESELGVKCFVHEPFDTDVLGTFSGEVERTMDPITTAREKSRMAMELSRCDLGVASEGSFGPHPSMYFVNADEEFLVFIDRVHGLEIIVRELSTETNFDGKEIKDFQELQVFAEKAGFPAHGLILRRSKNDFGEIYKGIVDADTLKEAFEQLLSKAQSVYVETDMRANYNPTRMKVIEKAAVQLLEKIKSTCPTCGTPGFGVTSVKTGLPCSLCGRPTNSTLAYISECQKCHCISETPFPKGKEQEDPMYCDNCNP